MRVRRAPTASPIGTRLGRRDRMHEGAKRTPERRETEGCAGTSSRFRRARCGEAGASSRRRSASDVRSEIRATLRAPPSSGTPRRRGLRQRVPAGRADVRSATSWIGAAVTPSPSSAGPSHVRTVCGWRGQSRTVSPESRRGAVFHGGPLLTFAEIGAARRDAIRAARRARFWAFLLEMWIFGFAPRLRVQQCKSLDMSRGWSVSLFIGRSMGWVMPWW